MLRISAKAQAAFYDELQMVLHLLYSDQSRLLVTPFHNMTLCWPGTLAARVDQLITTLSIKHLASYGPSLAPVK